MSKRERIAELGLWPRAMGADMAAVYCGVSKSDFYRKVEAGTYPKGFENGGLVQWDKWELDEAIEHLKRRRKTKAVPQDAETPDTIGKALDSWTPAKSAS